MGWCSPRKRVTGVRDDVKPFDSVATVDVERQGFDMLLAAWPLARVFSVESLDPWTTVVLATGRHGGHDRFAIWRHTGNVYRMNGGMVEDDPFLIVTPLTPKPPKEYAVGDLYP